jgi:hypothetical protein
MRPHFNPQYIRILLFIFLLASTPVHAQELNTILMNSTFELRGPNAQGNTTVGTVFIMGKPMKADATKAYYVLITAAHVLDEVAGENAQLLLRVKKDDGTYETGPYSIPIRAKGVNLYVKHPDADVAAMYLRLPDKVVMNLLPISLLATDDTLTEFEIHPGDELLCLGFPLSVDFNGFPVIRTGTLASYPLTPSKLMKTYYYNFHVFPGNSGGPVYFSFSNRIYNGGTHIGIQQGVIGLVIQQVNSNLPGYTDAQLDIAKIIPSSFIIETINLLPESP